MLMGCQGLRLLSVHMPRGPWDMDAEKVRMASEELGLIGPSALDSEHAMEAQARMDAIADQVFRRAVALQQERAAADGGPEQNRAQDR